jgi:carbamoyl-phosphate synthase large subunit
MAIGRGFAEVLQKALRMLDIGVTGLDPAAFEFADLEDELRRASPRRVFAIARALKEGWSVERLAALTQIDPFFLHEMVPVVEAYRLPERWRDRLRGLKAMGFADRQLARLASVDEAEVREERKRQGVTPSLLQIDTTAAEHPAVTNYAYLTYNAAHDDLGLPAERFVMILGSGPYRIGSSVEFDWCCVGAAAAARECGYKSVVLNCNPETVSTDYDASDLLVFDEISLETVTELWGKRREAPDGDSFGRASVVVSMGGQLPNNLALALSRVGIDVLGTAPEQLDRAEDRNKFGELCDRLGIDQPRWTAATTREQLDREIEMIGGYPVVVRPSYVLSGAAMRVVQSGEQLSDMLGRAARVSPEHPVVISKFEANARELEIDAVAQSGEVVLWAIAEHVESAGVHSGDATMVIPPQRLYLETIRRARRIAEALARELCITGPFNVQFLARHNEVKVIECNLRASRSFPFVSKVTGTDFARVAMRRMLGVGRGKLDAHTLELDHVGVKAPQFSFGRLAGADPFPGIEMSSTGEAACLGDELEDALLKALASVGLRPPANGVLLSLGKPEEKYRFVEEARMLAQMGLALYATSGTERMLAEASVATRTVARSTSEAEQSGAPLARQLMEERAIDLVINIARTFDAAGHPDGYEIRRYAVDRGIGLITDIDLARLFVQAVWRWRDRALPARAWNSYA